MKSAIAAKNKADEAAAKKALKASAGSKKSQAQSVGDAVQNDRATLELRLLTVPTTKLQQSLMHVKVCKAEAVSDQLSSFGQPVMLTHCATHA